MTDPATPPLPTYEALRYVLPLREGGSLPAVVEVEEAGLFAAKFRGAGQGARALVAELIGGLLARQVGLPVPEVALIHLSPSFGRTERDPEIQDLLRASSGLNVGLRYLDGAFNYDPLAAASFASPDFAADLVWFDAYLMNLDRTPRNPNLLVWQRSLWLIDHGAALYFHHDWDSVDEARIHAPFPPIRDHVLLPLAGDLEAADERLSARLDEDVLRTLLGRIPDALLMDVPEGRRPPFPTAQENRDAYLRFLAARLSGPRRFLEEALRARRDLPHHQTLSYRR